MSNKVAPRERVETADSEFFEKDTSDEVKLPEIEVSVKFYNLKRVDTANHEWDAEFVVMLDWMPTKNMEDFVPKIDIENAVEKAEPNYMTLSVRTRIFQIDHVIFAFKIKSTRFENHGKKLHIERKLSHIESCH